MKFKYLFVFLLLAFTIACGDDEGDEVCETANLTYNNDIAAIINTNCALSGCHNADAALAGTLPMTNFTETTGGALFNRIVGAINHETGFSEMPRNADQLDQCLIDQIEAWIDNGAPE